MSTRQRPSLIVNIKPTPEGFQLLEIQTMMVNSTRPLRNTSILRPPTFDYRRPERNDIRKEDTQQDISGVNKVQTSVSPQQSMQVLRKMPVSALWFDQNSIHAIQRKAVPQFFYSNQSDMFQKGPELYKFYRNSIIRIWKENAKPVTTSVCRRSIPGDACALMRIHKLLQNWGIINFPSKENKGVNITQSLRPACHICSRQSQTVFVAQLKRQFVVCQECYLQEMYPLCLKEELHQVRLSQWQQRDEPWTQEENLKLLQLISKEKEALNWNNIARQFPSRPKEKILLHFLKLPASNITRVHIFQNGQDILPHEQPQEESTVFEDINNVFQLSALQLVKKAQEGNERAAEVLEGARLHTKYLSDCLDQKIVMCGNQLIDLHLQKIAQSSLLLQECDMLNQQRVSMWTKARAGQMLTDLRRLLV